MTVILVTGGTGFVGSNLVRKLCKTKNDIHLLIRNSSDLWRINDIKNKLTIHKIDFHNIKKLEKTLGKIQPKVVFHLAAYGVKQKENNVSKILDTNILGTFNLFSTLSNQNVKRIVNVGSVFEYGLHPSTNGFLETNYMEPLTMYGITKVAQTNIAKYFFYSKHLPVTTLRLFTPYGMFEEKNRLIPSIMLSIINKKKLKISSSTSFRDFIFIDDVIDALIKASKIPGIDGEIFNIGSGKSYSVENIVKISHKLSNNQIKPIMEHNSKSDYNLLDNKGYANISKSKKFLKWKPKYSLQEGLKKTYCWYQKNSSLYHY